MAGKKYNYEDTMQILFNAYNNNEKVDYATIESSLGLEYSIADKEHKATTRSAVHELRKLLRSEYNLLLKNAASANCQGPEYHYFTVVDIKDVNSSKKEIQPSNDGDKDKNYAILEKQCNALASDNQKMYTQLEALNLKYNNALNRIGQLEDKEELYKNIISSMQALLSLS